MEHNDVPGPAVDAKGRPVKDPTENVLELVRAAIQRQDDLREAAERHVKEVAELRARYDAQLRTAETARIDAIRAVDVGAVQRAAEVSTQAAATLAAQVATSAETLRAQVAAAAGAATVALAAALEPIKTDIASLRQTQYEQAGARAQTVDTRDSRTDARGGASLLIAGFGVAALVVSVVLTVVTFATR